MSVLLAAAFAWPVWGENAKAIRQRYQAIIDRNPFGLRPPPPPEPEKPKEQEPEEEPVSIKELNIKLAGVSGKGKVKRAWLAMTLPSSNPEESPTERFYAFREEEEQHGIRLKKIRDNGEVEIEFAGMTIPLTFETHGYKKPAAKKTPGKQSPAARAAAIARARARASAARASAARALPKRGYPATNARARAVTGANRSGLRRTATRSRVAARTGSSSRTGVRRIPARQTRIPPPPRLSREEQIAILQAQRALANQDGRALPPIPNFHR